MNIVDNLRVMADAMVLLNPLKNPSYQSGAAEIQMQIQQNQFKEHTYEVSLEDLQAPLHDGNKPSVMEKPKT